MLIYILFLILLSLIAYRYVFCNTKRECFENNILTKIKYPLVLRGTSFDISGTFSPIPIEEHKFHDGKVDKFQKLLMEYLNNTYDVEWYKLETISTVVFKTTDNPIVKYKAIFLIYLKKDSYAIKIKVIFYIKDDDIIITDATQWDIGENVDEYHDDLDVDGTNKCIYKQYSDYNVINYPLITEKDLEDEAKREEKRQVLKLESRCHGIANPNEYTDGDSCANAGGIWDSEAINNKDCPFYKANKNYENSFGGSKFGYCQMPSGLQNVGFKHYRLDKTSQAICYNCNTNLLGRGTQGFCCDDQNNRELYPNLNSPDYKFGNDSELRQKSLPKNLSVD